MRRLSLGVVAGLCSTLVAAGTAYAAPMDFALSRLKFAPGNTDCAVMGAYCPDQAAFERLMLQFGTAMALPSAQPAATLGVQGFYIGVDTTLTTINGDQKQWTSGTLGKEGLPEGANSDVSSVLAWNRVTLRKGLPFGFEVDASMAQAASTQAWLIGMGVKWAIIEGFRTELGRLPDVALRGSLSSALGTLDSSVTALTMDLIASKPFVVQHAWVVTPMVVFQGVWVYADSDLVDFTPGIDALDDCIARPGHQPNAVDPATIDCRGDSGDYGNTVAFDRASSFNVRMTLGAEMRYRHFVTRGSLTYDLLAPDVATPDVAYPALSRQLSINLGVGVAF